jgi:nitroreductase
MDVYKTIISRRSIRRFKNKPIKFNILKKLVNAARLAPSAANSQPCEYIIVDRQPLLDRVFGTLKWAGYIAPLGSPPLGKRPPAYIVVLINRDKLSPALLNAQQWARVDAAAACQNIVLAAHGQGLGSCWLGSIDRPQIAHLLKIPENCSVEFVIALGFPDEHPRLEKLKDSVKYWKDKRGILHVPKRDLKELLHRNLYNKAPALLLTTGKNKQNRAL